MPALDYVVATSNLHDYFREQVGRALEHQQVKVREETRLYVSQLLAECTDPRKLFTVTPEGLEARPLAFLYADAVYAEGPQQRKLALKRLGDVALVIAGLFAGCLTRSLVGVDYYIAMGGTGYRGLHEALQNTSAGGPDPFGELAAKFARLVDVLAEVADGCHLGAGNDALRHYETWLRTGSQHSARQLSRHGIHPLHAPGLLRRH